MTEEATNLSTENGRLPEPWRGLRMYSSSALAELTPDDLADWAGTCRQAIDQFEQLQAEKARLERLASSLESKFRLYIWNETKTRGAKDDEAYSIIAKHLNAAIADAPNPSSPSGISREDEG
jgi:hypothetical protein